MKRKTEVLLLLIIPVLAGLISSGKVHSLAINAKDIFDLAIYYLFTFAIFYFSIIVATFVGTTNKRLATIGTTLIILGIVANYLESIYFGYTTPTGFNATPASTAEKITDTLCFMSIVAGFICNGYALGKYTKIEEEDQ